MKTFIFSLTLTLAFGLARPLRAQDVLQGRVTDAETSRPLEAVMVSVLRDSMTIDYTLTDADGRYSLPWRHKGTLQVSASMLGYGRQTRDVGKGGRLDFACAPRASCSARWRYAPDASAAGATPCATTWPTSSRRRTPASATC